MRILHLLDHSLPLHSGYTFRTAAILREQRRLGWETLQMTTPRHGSARDNFEDVDGLRFHRTPLRDGALRGVPGALYVEEMLATRARLDDLVASFRPEVLHAHSPVLNALPALSIGRRHGIPVVYEVRALWEDAAVDHGTTREGSLRYRFSRALETYALRRASHVTTICDGLRGEIAARGIPPGRVTVVPNAVDAQQFVFSAPPDAELRERLGLTGKVVLGFAGSFYSYEGLDLLIEAFAQLAAPRPDLCVLLVGGGPQEQSLRRLAQDLGVAHRVQFAGRVPHADVTRYYGLIDVLAYPRRRMRLTELVTPLKPLEAMAQGGIFVASDVGGHRELVRDGETGFLFPAGSVAALAGAIGTALAHRADWDVMRAKARRFVETERTWARSVAHYSDAYAAALARNVPQGARLGGQRS
jgi:hypothetical protein